MIKLVNKDFLIILIGKIVQVIVAIFSIQVVTRLFNPSEMGNIYIFTTVYTFFVLFFISPVGQYTNRKTHTWSYNKSILDHLSIYTIYMFIISIISIFMGYLLYTLGVSNGIDLKYFLPLLAGSIFFMTLHQTIVPILNMLYFRLSFTILMIFTSIGVLGFGYLFVSLFGDKSEYWILGMLVSNFIFLLIGFFVLKNRIDENFHGFINNIKKITEPKIIELLKFVLPLSIATLFMWLQNGGYRIVIEKEIGLEFLGFLGVGMAIASQIASIFESIIMQYFHPIYYKQITNADINERTVAINNIINAVLPIYLMLAIFVSFLAKQLVEILVDARYHDVYIFTIFAIWTEFFRMTTNLFGNISQSEMNTKSFIVPYISGSVLTIVLIYIVSHDSQYQLYIPVSILLGGFLTMIVMYLSMQKLIKFTIDYKGIGLSFIVSIPYLFLLFFKEELSVAFSLLVILVAGLYLLGSMFFVYRRGVK